MQVKDVMTSGVECIAPNATLQEAAQRMQKLDIGCLPVCDNDRVTGMVTDRDITIRATARGDDPKKTSVREAMTPAVAFCYEDQDIIDAARLMEERPIRRVPVMNRDKRLTGILGLGDLAIKAQDEQLAYEALERVSAPSVPLRAGA